MFCPKEKFIRPGETTTIETPAGEQVRVTVLGIKGNRVTDLQDMENEEIEKLTFNDWPLPDIYLVEI